MLSSQLWNGFRRTSDPATGRTRIQLTCGTDTAYPLYYFIDSITADGRYLVHHRTRHGQVQLYRLDLITGDECQLSHGTGKDTTWRPWCVESGPGILDHRTALDVTGNRALIWDDRSLISIDITSATATRLLELPPGREAIGQNCVLPGGEWYIFIHADSAAYANLFGSTPDWLRYWSNRGSVRGTVLAALNLQNGEQRELLRIDSPIHHVLPLDGTRMIFCHPTAENGMLLTDLNGGWYTHLRTQDEHGRVCHYVATESGIAYEVLNDDIHNGHHRGGLYHPDTHHRQEWSLPADFGYTHTARDPRGRRFCYESAGGNRSHQIHALTKIDDRGEATFMPVTDHWQTYGSGQKSHFHPQFVADGRWVLITGGDPTSRSNHCFLIDADGIPAAEGVLTASAT